jgi:hypothetical protein
MRRSFLRWAKVGLFAMTLAASTSGLAQEVKVTGGFMADSLRVGEEVFYYLSAASNKKQQVVFPDSTFDYSPFELLDKEYFATRTSDTLSFDSAVYHLATFEVDVHQALRLPVFVANPRDCTAFFSQRDSIRVRQQVKDLPEEISGNLPVRATIAYQDVPTRFNYPVILIGFTLLAVLAAVIWFTFGDRIHRHYRIRKIRRAHQQFITAYNEKIDHLGIRFSREEAEAALALWKKYMENVSHTPYTRLTTSEIRSTGMERSVVDSLRRLDTAIYGYDENVGDAFFELRKYTDGRIERLINEQNNG